MSLMPEGQMQECPLLRPVGAGCTSQAAIYCALPGGRVRVPARDERRAYCDAGRHERCPVSQGHVVPR